ncbi:MAG: tetratricopeptide repeat protein [Bryobacteraceae bacterium]|nr:tetratricopeptide repeat protein [Bryobacteraceae bacterium]
MPHGNPNPEEVQRALNRLLESETLGRSERLCRFLAFVVDRSVAGGADELKEYSIGVEVFDKGPDFDPRLDSAVRVDARRLRAKLAQYYASEGSTDPVRIDLPKGGYVPVFRFAGAGDPPAAVEDESDPAREFAPNVQPSRPRDRITRRAHMTAAAGLMAALALFLVWQWRKDRGVPSVAYVRSVVVLPFVNLTGNAAYDPLSDGLTDELTNRLARIDGLKVISRSSAFAYKGKPVDVRKVAAELQADSALEGSLREGGQNLRISVQLTRAADGSHAWSESFDLPKGDPLGVEAHIGDTIELRLASHLPPDSGFRPALNEQEQRIGNLVVQANHLMQRRSEASLKNAIEYSRQAIQFKPDYAQAFAVLADAYLGYADFRPREETAALLEQARQSARKATELNPNLAGPYGTLGTIAVDYEWKWREAEEMFGRALALNRNHPFVRARYSRLLSLQGRHDEAIQEAKLADMLSPVSTVIAGALGQSLYYARRYDEALAQFRKSLVLDPSYDSGRRSAARTLAMLGRYPEAWREAEALQPVSASAEYAALRVWMLAKEGRIAEAKALASQAAKASSISAAGAMAAVGDREQAFRVLHKAVAARDGNVVYLKVTPVLDPLRGDPRFEALCAKVGLKGCRI